MSPLYIYNDKLLIVNGALATSSLCCCSGGACCPTTFPINCYNLTLDYSTGYSGTSDPYSVTWFKTPCEYIPYKKYTHNEEITNFTFSNPTIVKCSEIASNIQSSINSANLGGGSGQYSTNFNNLLNESCDCIQHEETGDGWSYGSITTINCGTCCSGSLILNQSSGCSIGQTHNYRIANSDSLYLYENLPITSTFSNLECYDASGCCNCTGGTILDSCNIVFTVDSSTICDGLLSECGYCGICCRGGEYFLSCSYGDTPNGNIIVSHKLNCSKCCAGDYLLECSLGELIGTTVYCDDIPPEMCVGSTASISLDCTAPYSWCSNCFCEYNIFGESLTVEVNTPDGNFTISGTSNYLSDIDDNSVSFDCTSFFDYCLDMDMGYGVNITATIAGDFTKTYTGFIPAADSWDCEQQKSLKGLSFTIKKGCVEGTAVVS
jgi:hypothetical protein